MAQAFAPILEKFVVPLVEVLTKIMNLPLVPYILLAVVAVRSLGLSVMGVGKAFGSMFSLGKQALMGLAGLFKKGGFKEALGGVKDKLLGGFKQGATGVGVTESVAEEAKGKLTEGNKGGFKKGMEDLAGGLQAMGSKEVLKGIINLALAGPALVFAVASIPFLLAVAAVGIPAGKGLSGLAEGLTALGKAGGGALQGIGLLALFGVALIPLNYALSLLAPLVEAFGKALKNAFSGIAELITAVANGFVNIMNAVTMDNIGPMLLLGPALFGIAAGLMAVGAAGLMSLPGLGALAIVSKIAPSIVSAGA